MEKPKVENKERRPPRAAGSGGKRPPRPMKGGKGDGNRGRPMGPRKRHRSRTGRKEDAEFKKPEAAPKVKNTKSYFAELRETLSDAASVAEFIRKNNEKGLNDTKMLHTLIQVLSGRKAELYADLFSNHKSEVKVLLEFMMSLYSMKNAHIIPAAHEFIIRCNSANVGDETWANVTPVEGVQPSLFTPKEILTKIAHLDPLGQLQRTIEMSTTVEELQGCLDNLTALLFAKSTEDEDEDKLNYAAKCQLLSKFISKARRVAMGEVELEQTNVEEADPTAVEPEQPEETAPVEPAGKKMILTDEEKETFASMVTVCVKCLKKIMKVKPINASLQPLSKFTAFAKWCQANGLIDEKSFHVVSSLEEGQQEDLSEQTLQLETVLKLKAANTDNKLNEVELMQIVEELWNAGEQKHFFPFSADVLSSIGTAATSKDLSEAAGDLICERLLATHQFLQEKGAELPRRALRFVNTVQNRQKQAAISEQLAKEGLGRKKK